MNVVFMRCVGWKDKSGLIFIESKDNVKPLRISKHKRNYDQT